MLLRAIPPAAFGPLGAAFVCLVIGLLLDAGQPGSPRTSAAHLLQAVGVALLAYDAALLIGAGRAAVHLALAELGIALAVLGVLIEMRVGYRSLKISIAVQALGDGLFLAGAAVAVAAADQRPSTAGWVFIGLAGLLSLYAAISNLVLQLGRLRNPQAGWRYRVLGIDDAGLRLKTPGAEARIAWGQIEAIKQLDAHLLLVLPSPLPPELKASGLPFEELRTGEEALVPETAPPPEKYGFILHEQELGRALPEAAALFRVRTAGA